MSYSTNPVLDAERHTSSLSMASEAQEKAERYMAGDFVSAVRAGNMQAPAGFAGRVPDYSLPLSEGGRRPTRDRLVYEVMDESLGYGDGPSMADVMGLLVKVAAGEVQTLAARELIQQMAEAFARQNAGGDL